MTKIKYERTEPGEYRASPVGFEIHISRQNSRRWYMQATKQGGGMRGTQAPTFKKAKEAAREYVSQRQRGRK